jgi:TPR repeat protein
MIFLRYNPLLITMLATLLIFKYAIGKEDPGQSNHSFLHLLHNFRGKDELSAAQRDVFDKALAGDANSLNTIGLSLTSDSIFGPENLPLAASFFQAAAKKGHIIAAANLGRAYIEGRGVVQSQTDALHWFRTAAVGGHQGAMYNCGLLLAKGTPYVAAVLANDGDLDERGRVPGYFPADPIGALEFFRTAFLASKSPIPGAEHLISKEVTDAAVQAHETMCDTIAHNTFSSLELARVWSAGSLGDVSPAALSLWQAALRAIGEFNSTFVAKKGNIDSNARSHLNTAVEALGTLVEVYSGHLSHLQLHLALDNLQEMIGPLAGKDDMLAAPAGRYAEAYALSHYCRGKYAIKETDRAVREMTIFQCIATTLRFTLFIQCKYLIRFTTITYFDAA